MNREEAKKATFGSTMVLGFHAGLQLLAILYLDGWAKLLPLPGLAMCILCLYGVMAGKIFRVDSAEKTTEQAKTRPQLEVEIPGLGELTTAIKANAAATMLGSPTRASPITVVKYERLRSFGNFENEKIGVVVEVPFDGLPDDSMKLAQAYVNGKLAIAEETAEIEKLLGERRRELAEVADELASAKAKWEDAKLFLSKHGVTINDNEIPF